jgi:hypothetical protein
MPSDPTIGLRVCLASQLASHRGPDPQGAGPGGPDRGPDPACEKFLYGFKAAPRGRSRRRRGAQAVALAGAPLRPGQRQSAGARDGFRGPLKPRQSQGRGGFDKGTRAAALIGLMRAGRSQPDPRASVRAAAPCQFRRSVSAGLTVCRPVSGHESQPRPSRNLLTVAAGRTLVYRAHQPQVPPVSPPQHHRTRKLHPQVD